jgi:hypothetical protein
LRTPARSLSSVTAEEEATDSGPGLQLVEHQLQLFDDAVDLLRGAPEL